jgi:hypothetical protein
MKRKRTAMMKKRRMRIYTFLHYPPSNLLPHLIEFLILMDGVSR